jgi:hypothetical protein
MHIIDTTFAAQSKLFEKLLSEALQNGSMTGPTRAELELPCSTLIMRPQPDMAAVLAEKVAFLAERFPGQLYYGQSNLHMTVCALPDVVPGSILHRHLRRSLGSHVGALRALEMPVGGFGIIGSAVIFRAFDTDGLLGRMVKCLAADIEEEGFAMADMAGLHTQIFWLTAARLITEPSKEFLDYISQHQDERFGVANFSLMEIVSTDSLFSEHATQIMESYNLGDFS